MLEVFRLKKGEERPDRTVLKSGGLLLQLPLGWLGRVA